MSRKIMVRSHSDRFMIHDYDSNIKCHGRYADLADSSLESKFDSRLMLTISLFDSNIQSQITAAKLSDLQTKKNAADALSSSLASQIASL